MGERWPRGGTAILRCHSTLSFIHSFILRCHSTMSSAVIDCYPFGIHVPILRSVRPCAARMTVPPAARQARRRDARRRALRRAERGPAQGRPCRTPPFVLHGDSLLKYIGERDCDAAARPGLAQGLLAARRGAVRGGGLRGPPPASRLASLASLASLLSLLASPRADSLRDRKQRDRTSLCPLLPPPPPCSPRPCSVTKLYDVARRAAAAVITAVASVVTNFTLENDESTGACVPSTAYSGTDLALALRYGRKLSVAVRTLRTATAGPGPATRDDL
jgi:hypothetical protein